MTPLVSVVIPVHNEGESLVGYLDEVIEAMDEPLEVLVVHDTPDDSTVPVVHRYDPNIVKATLNTYGRGPANAIRYGMDAAAGDVVVVTMADGSDVASQISEMASLVRSGNSIVAASRYMKGGQQIGGPRMKGLMSRAAGVSLFYLARVGTHDATNSFKAYDPDFIRSVGVESTAGFELALELVSKARRTRAPVSEIPTTWTDRDEGESNFDLVRWLPKYLHWYFNAFGRPINPVRSAKAPSS